MRRGVKKLCIAALAAALAALSGCAESIYDNFRDVGSLQIVQAIGIDGEPQPAGFRSEERRVGKECRSRWSPYH